MQVADELGLDPEQVRPAGPDERDGLVEPALVALGGLVPGGAVRGVHGRHVGKFGGRRGADERCASSIRGA